MKKLNRRGGKREGAGRKPMTFSLKMPVGRPNKPTEQEFNVMRAAWAELRNSAYDVVRFLIAIIKNDKAYPTLRLQAAEIIFKSLFPQLSKIEFEDNSRKPDYSNMSDEDIRKAIADRMQKYMN